MLRGTTPTPTRDALQRLLDALQTFIREHLALARVELKEDLRAMGRDLAASAIGVPPLAAGYLLLMFAIGWLLAIWLPNWAAFGIVALVNLAVGGMLAWKGTRRVVRDRPTMPHTAEELRRDREWASSLGNGTRPAAPPATTAPVTALTQPGADQGPAH